MVEKWSLLPPPIFTTDRRHWNQSLVPFTVAMLHMIDGFALSDSIGRLHCAIERSLVHVTID